MALSEDMTISVERLDDRVVQSLCQDYAHYTRVNISEEHGQVCSKIYTCLLACQKLVSQSDVSLIFLFNGGTKQTQKLVACY